LFGVFIVVVGLLIQNPLLHLFRIEPASHVYFLVLLTCAISNIGAMLLSVFKGIQRMDKSNAIEIKMSIVSVVGTVILLEAGLGMFGLALNGVVSAVIALVVTAAALKREVAKVSFGWNFDRALLR